MRILIYGAGIQGSYLASVLAQNIENEVTLLARNQRKSDLEAQGLVLYHQLQRKTTRQRINVIEELKSQDFYDLVFVTMKYSDFNTVLPILAGNASQHIIFVGNQMDTTGLATALKTQSQSKKNIAFGFQTTGGTRRAGKIAILRFGTGGLKVSQPSSAAIEPLLAAAFATTAFKWKIDSELDQWLKSHGGFVMILNSLDYLFQQNDYSKEEKEKIMRLAAAAYPEMFRILTQNGYSVTPSWFLKLFGKANSAYRILRGLYGTSILKMQQGDFAEIVALYAAFDEFKQKKYLNLPNYEKLRQLALAAYEKDGGITTKSLK